jgi:predicted DNA-binding transcriptional regulator YafY
MQRKAKRIFSLTRMRNVAALADETFTLPPDFDYAAANKASRFGVFESRPEKFSLEFYDWAAVEVREREWVEGQKLTELDDGGVRIDFTAGQYERILGWVLSFGRFARPLAPSRLVDDWCENVEEMQKSV